MLNSKPNSNLNICTCSTSQGLHIYVMKSAKGDDEFEVTLEWKLLSSCSQVLKSSRSTLLNLPWSFVQRKSAETTWIFFNFQIPSTCGCSWICTKSCSIAQNNGWILLNEAPETRICKEIWSLYEENPNSKWEKLEGVLKFQIWIGSLLVVRIRVWLLYAMLMMLLITLSIC